LHCFLCFFLQSNNLKRLAGGVLAAKAFGSLTTEDKTQSLTKMLSYMTADGTFKLNADDQEGTTGNVHYALELLAAVGGENAGSELAVDVFEKAFRMLPGGDFEGESDATLMVPLSKLTDKKLRLVGDRLNTVAEVLLNKKHSTCMTSVSRVFDALELVAQYKASPLHVSFEQNKFESAKPESHLLRVSVKSILGAAVDVEAAEVVTIKTVGKDSSVLQGATFANGVLDMSSAKLSAGRYLAQITVTVAGRAKALPYQAYFAVVDTVAVKDVRFQLVEGDDDDSSSQPTVVSKQNSVSGVIASALAGDKLQVTFQVAAAGDVAGTRKPHQAVVRLTHQETGRSVFFTGKKGDAAGALSYAVTIAVGDNAEKFAHQSGAYTVTIQVGDAVYSAPTEFVLGSVDLRFPAKQAEHLPLYAKSLLHASDVTLKPLPEITHVMRPPAKRASNFMATLFTGLTVAPLVVFIVFLLHMRPDLARLGSLANLAALGCLALMLLLYVSYWLSLKGVSFYETIKYLCILTPVTVVVGSYSLASVKAMRVKAEAAKEKQN
jgi:hypothetical protein